MTAVPPSLAGADWLVAPAVQAIFAAVGRDGEEVRIVGGAVRNALMGRPVADIDFATTATPERIAALAAAAGLKSVPTGADHGTLTIVAGGRGYEVTTLREDIETDGRHAVVRFGRDWVADAKRRDFTVNALSVDAGGAIADALGGYADIVAGRIRFVGDPDRRIAEDRLRILRFFRLTAEYAADTDATGLLASMRAREGLRDLSAERVGQEMRKLVVAPRATDVLATMQESGILPIVLGGIGYLPQFARFAAVAASLGWPAALAPRLAVLACEIEEDVARLTERLRLANIDRDRMLALLAASRGFGARPDERQARALLYRQGVEAYRDGAGFAFAWSGAPPDDRNWRNIATLPARWTAPQFPLTGGDVLGDSRIRGPAVGELLRALEAWWIERDFEPGEAELRGRLQQMIAAVQ